jgi:hypothetical protein
MHGVMNRHFDLREEDDSLSSADQAQKQREERMSEKLDNILEKVQGSDQSDKIETLRKEPDRLTVP